MAKTYTLNEQEAPSNPDVQPITGGSLSASTTYYYRVVLNTAYAGAYYNTETTISVPSTEVSTTTTGTKKSVAIYFDNNNTIPYANCFYMIYRTKVSGDYKQTDASGVWQKHLVPVTGRASGMGYALNSASSSYCRAVYEFTCTGAIASLVAGETITEQVSGATAIVVSDPAGTDTFKVRQITGTWNGSNPFNGSESGTSVGTWASTSAQVGWCIVDTIADSSCYSSPLYEDGVPTLFIEGGDEEDPITPENIYDWLIANGKDYCITGVPVFPDGDAVNASGNNLCKLYQWRFNLQNFDADTPCFLLIANENTIQQVWGKIYLGRHSIAVFGKIDDNGRTYDGGIFIRETNTSIYSGFNNSTTTTGSFQAYASYIGGGVYPFTNSSLVKNDIRAQFLASTPLYIYDSIIKSDGRMAATYDIRRTRYINSNSELGNTTGYSENVAIDSYIATYYALMEAVYQNLVIVTNGVYDAQISLYREQNILSHAHFVNPVWAHETPTFRVNAQSEYLPGDCLVTEEFDFSLTVTDNNGNPIEGATVTIVDSNGDPSIFTLTTMYPSNLLAKTGTSLGITNDSVSIGDVYRSGVETFSIDSGSNPYNITRSVNGINHNIGGTRGTLTTQKFYKQEDSMTTDSDGNVSCTLVARYWLTKDVPVSLTVFNTPISLTPHTVTISKSGYQTRVIKYNMTEKRTEVEKLTADGTNISGGTFYGATIY